ncbi:hypothetical protein CRE_00416 [Caenorhabditis remanei]|uniref:Uncharacterized protein n=1 Tax=Caenorhabditis remanei TaxID=31234 RepID=E3LCG7_CAERE|nr:hypothetical protein CRE_00416 [Caenorhabditis remanei]
MESDTEDDNQKICNLLQARHTLKIGEELEKAVATLPKILRKDEKKIYLSASDLDYSVAYEQVTRKGETYNEHPESVSEFVSKPVVFNKQIEDRDLADLKDRCNTRQFVEAVKLLPEFNFSTDETWDQIKRKKKSSSPCFECGVSSCFRLQQRWQGRVLHGCYPNIPLLKFQHDSTDKIPSCFYVNNENPLADKFADARKVIKEIERH